MFSWTKSIKLQLQYIQKFLKLFRKKFYSHQGCEILWIITIYNNCFLYIETFEQVSKFFLFWWNIFFFLFSTALQRQQKILACFPEDKLSIVYLDLQIQNVFAPPPPPPLFC